MPSSLSLSLSLYLSLSLSLSLSSSSNRLVRPSVPPGLPRSDPKSDMTCARSQQIRRSRSSGTRSPPPARPHRDSRGGRGRRESTVASFAIRRSHEISMRVFSDFKLQHERLCGIRGLLSLVQLLWRRVDNFVGLCSSFRSCPLISPVKRKKTKKVRLRGGGAPLHG